MPLLDLQQHLKQELLNNPFLEMVEPEEETRRAEGRRAGEASEKEKTADDEIDWEEILLDGFDAGGRRGSNEEREYFEPVTVDTRDLTDHLRDQITLLDARRRASCCSPTSSSATSTRTATSPARSRRSSSGVNELVETGRRSEDARRRRR